MTFSGSFSGPWDTGGVIWAPRWRPKANSKSLQKLIEFSVIFGSPRGEHATAPAGQPGSKKRTFSAKVVISLQRGANFQILDFGTPLEKSVSLTFSEQWLCHFSKDSGVVFPVGAHGSGKPHANFVHGGTVADIWTVWTSVFWHKAEIWTIQSIYAWNTA